MSADPLVQLTDAHAADGIRRNGEMARAAEREDSPAAALTVVVTVAVAPERVWRELGDVEALPRWAAGFCERVTLTQGRWVAWTALGEWWVELETDARAAGLTLRFSADARAWQVMTLTIAAAGDEGTRVTLAAHEFADLPARRFGLALRDALGELPASLAGARRLARCAGRAA